VPQITSGLVGVLAIAGAFLILIAPHEGGHFALAKLFRVRDQAAANPWLRSHGRHGGG
jgi:hypothetical protein